MASQISDQQSNTSSWFHQAVVRLRMETWTFYFGNDSRRPADYLFFPDRQTALTWLARFKYDPIAMMSLRRLVFDHFSVSRMLRRCPDDEILKELAFRLVNGSLLVLDVLPSASAASPAHYAAPGPGPYLSPQVNRPPSAPAPAPQDPDTLSPAIDGAAMAAVLCAAAENGIPFCAECARAAAAKRAQGAPVSL